MEEKKTYCFKPYWDQPRGYKNSPASGFFSLLSGTLMISTVISFFGVLTDGISVVGYLITLVFMLMLNCYTRGFIRYVNRDMTEN